MNSHLPKIIALNNDVKLEIQGLAADAEVHHDEDCNPFVALPDGTTLRLHQSGFDRDGTVAVEEPERDSLPLHSLCSKSHVTLDELMETLHRFPEHASKVDAGGKLPLHVLGENQALLQLRRYRDVLVQFLPELMNACPHGITQVCNDGYIPFVRLIKYWVEAPHEFMANSTQLTVTERVHVNRATRSHCVTVDKEWFHCIEMSAQVECCLEFLSLGLDHIFGHFLPNGPRKTRAIRLAQACELSRHVATLLPTLPKSILMVEFDEIRQRLMNLTLVRRLWLEPLAIGPWLVGMLGQPGVSSERAVQHLAAVSNASIQDYAGTFLMPSAEDFEAFYNSKHQVFTKIGGLPNLVPCLLVLSPRKAQIASSSAVVKKVIATALSRSFGVGTVIHDFVVTVTLLIAYRNAVLLPPIDGSQIPEGLRSHFEIEQLLVFIGSAYFLLQKLTEALTLLNISFRVYYRNLINIWNVMDLLTLSLLIATANVTAPEDIFQAPIAKGITLWLLWIRLLYLFKAVNVELATFIFAMLQVCYDIRWFLVVMMVSIFAFGDMLHLITRTVDNGAVCQNTEESALLDLCTDSYLDTYIRLYIVFVGDFVLSQYQGQHGAITAVFIIFTFIGFVILGNVLIAVVGNSYETAKETSEGVFGQARLDHAVVHLSLERMMVPSLPIYAGRQGLGVVVESLLFVYGWFTFFALLATTAFVEYFLISMARNDFGFPISFALLAGLLAFVLALATLAMVQELLEVFTEHKIDRWLGPTKFVTDIFVGFVTKRIFAIDPEDTLRKKETTTNDSDED